MPSSGGDADGDAEAEKYRPTKFKAKDSRCDKDAADFAVMFIESLCHTKGTWAGSLELIDWQEQIIRDIFGTLKPERLPPVQRPMWRYRKLEKVGATAAVWRFAF